jgi:8-oxo-dGTP pyrophosphatase MutT (NUDIX family)
LTQRRIRPLALAVIRRDDRILVFEAHDSVKDETFYRLLGGGIEFGDRGEEAIRRELVEELGVEQRGQTPCRKARDSVASECPSTTHEAVVERVPGRCGRAAPSHFSNGV